METNLDLTKILKVGQEVYSPAFGFGKVVSTSYDILDERYQYPILVRFFHKISEKSTKDEEYTVFRESFTKEGKYCHLTSDDAECILFPSKEERDWSKLEQRTNVSMGEQNPADKSEPKFNVGDCITNGERTWFIEGVHNGFYDIVSPEGLRTDDTIIHVDEHFHLWTIQDAKPGDVFHSTVWGHDSIFIFNGLDNWKFDEPNGDRTVATAYCDLDIYSNKMEFGTHDPDCIEIKNIKPATNIQRGLLFQKMKEAGYEWDDEKKELKKITIQKTMT